MFFLFYLITVATNLGLCFYNVEAGASWWAHATVAALLLGLPLLGTYVPHSTERPHYSNE